MPSIETNPAKFMEIYVATVNFYILEDIKSRVPKNNKARKLIEEVKYYQEEFYAPKMARTLFDYLSVAALGELRYAFTADNVKRIPISKLYMSKEQNGNGAYREKIYSESIYYDPKQFLVGAKKLFSESGWGNGYGGKKWATVCKKALEYYTLSPIRFIDNVIDLTHNNGLVYNKPALVTCKYESAESLLSFLDEKSNCKSFLEENIEHALILCDDCKEFLNRAVNLFDIKLKAYISSITVPIKFPFVEWGTKLLKFNTKEKYYKKENEEE